MFSPSMSRGSPKNLPQGHLGFQDRLRLTTSDVKSGSLSKARRGRVYGPMGAAAKLGIPPSTLRFKIKILKIRKGQFKYLGSLPERSED
jgi:hypothetical protein